MTTYSVELDQTMSARAAYYMRNNNSVSWEMLNDALTQFFDAKGVPFVLDRNGFAPDPHKPGANFVETTAKAGLTGPLPGNVPITRESREELDKRYPRRYI